jgi:hypothetical protein
MFIILASFCQTYSLRSYPRWTTWWCGSRRWAAGPYAVLGSGRVKYAKFTRKAASLVWQIRAQVGRHFEPLGFAGGSNSWEGEP